MLFFQSPVRTRGNQLNTGMSDDDMCVWPCRLERHSLGNRVKYITALWLDSNTVSVPPKPGVLNNAPSPIDSPHTTDAMDVSSCQPQLLLLTSTTSRTSEHRRRLLEQAQKDARHAERQRLRALRRNRVRRRLQSVGIALQRLNVAKWIDDLEREQELADKLDRVNADLAQEQAMLQICRQAEAECLQAVRDHMNSFLEECPEASYEDWIRDLHPDNVSQDCLQTIDARFYVQASDHLRMWNDTICGSGAGDDNDLPSPGSTSTTKTAMKKSRALVPSRRLMMHPE
jgi:hypothetical protein